jgi:Haem-NO-binding
MKGVVFTEFLDMVEGHFSVHMVDDIIEDCDLASGGAYTAVGTYPHEEMVALMISLSKRSGQTVPDLLRFYGQYLFGRFYANYPAFFVGIQDTLSFLAGIEDIIHAEVLKLYPDAELPRFEIEHIDKDKLILLYDSRRHFEDLAEGLILGCISHFGEEIQLRREVFGHGEHRKERFTLNRP